MRLDDLVRDLEADMSEGGHPLGTGTARNVVSDISYGVDARRAGLNPIYFSLYHLPEHDEIIMLPHHFALWEGFVNLLRLVALRRPDTYLSGISNKLRGWFGASRKHF